MTMKTMTRLAPQALTPTWTPRGVTAEQAGRVVGAFLDTASTSFGRATHYNTRAEQQAAELAVHHAMLALDRDLYALLLLVPGCTDRARQLGLRGLLGTPGDRDDGLLNAADERTLLARLVNGLPPQRLLRALRT